MQFRVTYLSQWSDEVKNFNDKSEAIAFAISKGYSKSHNYVKIEEIIKEQKKKINI